MPHRVVRGPAGEERDRSRPSRDLDQPVVNPEKVETLATDLKRDDPGLGLFRSQPEFGQQVPKPQ